MVSEIKRIGAESMQVMPQAAPAASRQSQSPADLPAADVPGAQVNARHAAFSALAGIKDEAAYVALSVRQAGQTLERAEATVEIMREKVQAFLVKNFPPFPPGSDERQDYLYSISALRRQLESMAIPPMEGKTEPVFYPREWDLPGLDPATASNEEVKVFGGALDDMARRIHNGYSELEAIVGELPSWLPLELPSPPGSDEHALDASQVLAAQLPRYGAALMDGSETLKQFIG